jgi:hypothetical protein
MRWSQMSRLLIALSLIGLPFLGRSQWVAFNDHAATNTTHANATRWNVFGTANGAPGASGPLKNIATGANLPVSLSISNFGADPAGTQGQPAAGTPTYNAFNGFVNFEGLPSPSVELEIDATTTNVVTYTFTGLNTARRYNFIGTAVRGNAGYVDRWTLIEIHDAVSATAAHTVKALTTAQVPALTANQVAINTGVNNSPTTGDYASWDNIQPSANGTIRITCRQYTGTVPGGSSAGPRGYSITGIRLEELGTAATPVAITTQSQSQSVNAGSSVVLGVTVTGSTPRYFQWYKDGNALLNKTNQVLSFNPITLADGGTYQLIVTNSLNSATSAPIVLSVFLPPVVYTNLSLTNVAWKYNQGGAEPASVGGVNWKQTNYNDSSWSTGRGILALETDNAFVTARTNTVLSLTDGGGNRIVTYYFRNQFVLTNDPSAVTLSMSNVIDDGAVVYLNGTQVWRNNMPNGTIAYGTFSSGTQAEGTLMGTNLPSSLLIEGTNTIAVEVHQVNLTSSDVVFGMQVTTLIPPPTALSIVSHPQSLVVEEDKDAIFTVGIAGGSPSIQWYKDGVAISNATRPALTIPIVRASDVGTYVAVATNIVNSVTSAPATLAIYADTNPPALLLADGTENATNVTVTFSERLTAVTATNTGNYSIGNTVGGAATLAISKAILLADGKTVVLTTAARVSGTNYILTVNNLRDLATPAPGNLIPANSATPIIQAVPLILLHDNRWSYYNPFPPPFGGDEVEIGTSWRNPGYDEATSGVPWTFPSVALFYNGNSDESLPGTVNTALSQSEAYVDYYRMVFDAKNVSPAGLILEFTHVIDDGAIFYLNGQELFRYNMSAGTLASNDVPANATVGNAGRVQIEVPGSLIVTGQNLLAVSVHQAQRIDIDRTFGLELTARAQSFVTGPVIVTTSPREIFVPEGQTTNLTFTSSGAFRFQWRSNTVAIAAATNSSYTTPRVTTNMSGTVYTVNASNATSGLLSTNAILRVIADTNGPAIVSAFVGSNNTSIVVSFNEPMLLGPAQTLGNYVVQNSTGGNVAISGATLANETNVVLSFGSTLGGLYTVTINNVTDASSQTNKIAPNSTVTVGAQYSIGMTSGWKYLLINTNDSVQEQYFGTAFDDSTWSGPSNALFYVEGAGLPFAKSTPLSLTDGADNDINTFYFRKSFFAPIGSTNVTLRLRHVIDDGMVLYLNGREIYRYNMPNGVIGAGTQALSPAIGDATVQGPFDVVVTNLIGGTNLFAAEVHQNGAASSDVVFGLEITGTIPSVVVTNRPVQIVAQPQSRTNAVGTPATFSVVADGSPVLRYQWRTNGVAILNATNATLNVPTVQLSDNGKAFTVVISNFVNSVTSSVATLTVTNNCTVIPVSTWTNNFKLSVVVTNRTNIALSWSNPVTNSCGSNAAVILRQASTFTGNGTANWTNLFTNVNGSARIVVTNATTNAMRFYRLQVP